MPKDALQERSLADALNRVFGGNGAGLLSRELKKQRKARDGGGESADPPGTLTGTSETAQQAETSGKRRGRKSRPSSPTTAGKPATQANDTSSSIGTSLTWRFWTLFWPSPSLLSSSWPSSRRENATHAGFLALEAAAIMKALLELQDKWLAPAAVASLSKGLQDQSVVMLVYHEPTPLWDLAEEELMRKLQAVAHRVTSLAAKSGSEALLQGACPLLRDLRQDSPDIALFKLSQKEAQQLRNHMRREIAGVSQTKACLGRRPESTSSLAAGPTALDDSALEKPGKLSLEEELRFCDTGEMPPAHLREKERGEQERTYAKRLAELQEQCMWTADLTQVAQILTLAVFHTRHVLLESFKSSGGSSLGGDPSVAATLEAESLGAVALGTLYAKIILQALQISDFTFLARSAARDKLYELMTWELKDLVEQRLAPPGEQGERKEQEETGRQGGQGAHGDQGERQDHREGEEQGEQAEQGGQGRSRDEEHGEGCAAEQEGLRPAEGRAVNDWEGKEDDAEFVTILGSDEMAGEGEAGGGGQRGEEGEEGKNVVSPEVRAEWIEKMQWALRLLAPLAASTAAWDEANSVQGRARPSTRTLFRVQTLHAAQKEAVTSLVVDVLVGLTHHVVAENSKASSWDGQPVPPVAITGPTLIKGQFLQERVDRRMREAASVPSVEAREALPHREGTSSAPAGDPSQQSKAKDTRKYSRRVSPQASMADEAPAPGSKPTTHKQSTDGNTVDGAILVT